jgi:peptidoglycan hydrolase-like protein with peptidoglycan-binding domain
MALLQVVGEGTARDEAEALARLTLAQAGGVPAARRYADALRRRVPPAQAGAATARVRGERSRGAVVTPDRPLARFAQSGLAGLGAWAGPVDGRDSPATRAALMAFAQQEGLAASGPYDPAVLDRLRERLAPR